MFTSTSSRLSSLARPWRPLMLAAVALGAVLGLSGRSSTPAHADALDTVSFQMFPVAKFVPCMTSGVGTPVIDVVVQRGRNNDQMTLTLRNFRPGLQFDLFTVQRSNQNADGTPVQGFTNFGLAWYQTDVEITSSRATVVTFNTILLDQIFGFDPDVSLAPLNTFHVGMWFNSPADAAPCGFTGSTPFNGEHNAGPLAAITRPNADSNLGPLCSNPNFSTNPVSCNP